MDTVSITIQPTTTQPPPPYHPPSNNTVLIAVAAGIGILALIGVAVAAKSKGAKK